MMKKMSRTIIVMLMVIGLMVNVTACSGGDVELRSNDGRITITAPNGWKEVRANSTLLNAYEVAGVGNILITGESDNQELIVMEAAETTAAEISDLDEAVEGALMLEATPVYEGKIDGHPAAVFEMEKEGQRALVGYIRTEEGRFYTLNVISKDNDSFLRDVFLDMIKSFTENF